MRRTIIVLSICSLLLVSTVAFYRACESKPPINSNEAAIVASAKRAEEERRRAVAEQAKASPNSSPDYPEATSRNDESLPESPSSYPDEGARKIRPLPMPHAKRQKDSASPSSSKNIHIIDYPPVRNANFAEVAENPSFAIEILSYSNLIVADKILREGMYRLSLKKARDSWVLLFYRENTLAIAAILPLKLETTDYTIDKLMVVIGEDKGKATIKLRLGVEELSGSFEVR